MGTIAQKLAAVASSKAAIGTAIEGRGGTVPTKLSDYGTAVAALPNAYAQGDEGKVVSSGALVSQTSLSVTSNNTYDTTTKNSVVVAVPNTYAAGDEGKVVSSGELVAQTSRNIDQNGTYDTTTNNSVTVSVSGGGGGSSDLVKAMASRSASSSMSVTASDLSGITKIGNSAFKSCDWLTSIDIPSTVTKIEDNAFDGCQHLVSCSVPNGVTEIGQYAFQNVANFGSGLIQIPSGVTKFGTAALKGCRGLRSLTVPDNGKIDSRMCYGCTELTTVVIGSGVTWASSWSKGSEFESCTKLTSVTIGSGLAELPNYMFKNCNLSTITVPDSVATIGNECFANNANLATIDFGTTRSTIPTLNNVNAFNNIAANYQILVPAALLTDWKAANNWNNSAIVDHIVAHP